MRRFLTIVAVLAMAAGSVAYAQTKVDTPEMLDKCMKGIGASFGAVFKAVGSGAFADAKTELAKTKAYVTASQEFWVVNKKDDALQMAKDTVAKLEVLEKALSAPTPDAAAVGAAAKDAGGACAACHGKYREQDATTKAYGIKAGTI